MKLNVMFARFPYHRCEEPDVTDWMIETVLKAKADPRVGRVLTWKKDDTPITMTRNLCLEVAKREGMDVVVMIDNDMKPDAYLKGSPNAIGVDPLAKPFWDSSWEFLLQHRGPCVIAAPYCGPPPVENVYVFRWATYQSDHPNRDGDVRLEQFSREDAATRAGMEEVGALPTGLLMMSVKAVEGLRPPHFYYEWSDKTESKKDSTEDVTFTRDVSLAGVPVYCNWDAWAGHWKRKCVGKPVLLPVTAVRENFREVVLRGRQPGEKLVMVGEGAAPQSGRPRPGKKKGA